MNIDGVKVVTIGGGTGSYMLLSGLKRYVSNLTAIVNMVDNGGSTGKLRDEFGTLPSGDVRQCLVALAESDRVRNLFSYRFNEESKQFGGHSFGNIFLSTLEQVTGSFSDAVETAGEVLNIKGRVLPVTLSDVNLTYTNKQGETVIGEHAIGDTNLLEEDDKPELGFDKRALINPHARRALIEADLIVIAPGTVYGSLAPSLMVEGVGEALSQSRAQVVYVANLTNSPETKGYSIKNIFDELNRLAGSQVIDTVLFNDRKVKSDVARKYQKQNQPAIKLGKFDDSVSTKKRDLLSFSAMEQQLIRHDPDKVARAIMNLYFS